MMKSGSAVRSLVAPLFPPCPVIINLSCVKVLEFILVFVVTK